MDATRNAFHTYKRDCYKWRISQRATTVTTVNSNRAVVGRSVCRVSDAVTARSAL